MSVVAIVPLLSEEQIKLTGRQGSVSSSYFLLEPSILFLKPALTHFPISCCLVPQY